jgi:hypothetical protein
VHRENGVAFFEIGFECNIHATLGAHPVTLKAVLEKQTALHPTIGGIRIHGGIRIPLRAIGWK